MKIINLIKHHEEYRSSTISLIPSENVMSETARRALSSDLVHRYIDSDFYGGTKYMDEIVNLTREFAKRLFNVDYAFVEPLSGTMCVIATILAYTKSGDKIATLREEDGGFPFRYNDFERKLIPLPFDEKEGTIDVERAKDVIAKEKPKLIILGASIIPFPHPVKEISEFAEEYGIPVVYDGSHVLGLIAGGKFQDPIREGALVLMGSTHKTFPGPQGGLILTNDDDAARRLAHYLDRPPLLIDNPHVHRIASLGITLEEMLEFGKEYAEQIIKNSKVLGETLHSNGLKIMYPEKGFTETHQVLMKCAPEEGRRIRDILENAGIITDAWIRFGTQEITRLGAKEEDVKEIGLMIINALEGQITNVRNQVIEMRRKLCKVHYSFD